MTPRSRATMVVAVVLSALVVVTALPLIRAGFGKERVDPGSAVALALVVGLALASVPIVYVTRVRKGALERLLHGDFAEDYEVISDAVLSSQLPTRVKHEVRDDVLEMLISVQRAGRPLRSAVSDPEAFAADIVSAYGRGARLTILSLADCIAWGAFLTVGVTGMLWLEDTSRDFYRTDIGTQMLALILAVAFVILPLTRSLAFRPAAPRFALPLAFGLGYVLLAEAFRKWMYDVSLVRAYLDGSVVPIPNPAALAALVTLVVVALLLKQGLRRAWLSRAD